MTATTCLSVRTAAILAVGSIALAQSRTYTLNADFDEGTLTSVNHSIADQLQLDTFPGGGRLDFVAVAATGRNTLVRFDANTGVVFGEYRTAPTGLLRNPSRTSVDAAGNVWVGNRDEISGGLGSVCRIGIVVGGTRVNADGSPNPVGLYLAPPFLYNTCVDRDNDGLIRTSMGLNDVLAWPNVTDGAGGPDGLVQDAVDEAIQIFQRTSGVQVRHVSVDAAGDAWVGGYPSFPTSFDKLSGVDGAVLASFVAPGCGGHGGVVSGGILWSTSLTENSVMRYDTATGIGTCIPMTSPHGMAKDTQGNIWVAQFDLNMVSKLTPAGVLFPGFPKRTGGGSFDRSLAVTPADDNVWVGNSAANNVSRLDNNGLIRKVIDLGANGNSPRGVSVDGNGKVWVTNLNSNNAMRIDPNGAADGLGAVDLTVDLGANAAPYDFGDMTGSVPLGLVQPNGSWNVVYDSGTANTQFGTISWNASVPANTAFAVSFRVANSQAALAGLPFQPASNGVPFTGVSGRFVEVHCDFTRANPSVTATPVLFDLTILGMPPPPDDDDEPKPGNGNPVSLLVFPEFDNVTGNVTMITVTNVDSELGDVDVEYVYIGREGNSGQLIDCLETNRTRRMTPNDTLTVITRFDNPNQQRGYLYVFAKSPISGRAIVHDSLIGSALILKSEEVASYSFQPFGYAGIGEPGTETDHDNDGLRDLNGIEYQKSSDETLVPRFFGQGDAIHSELVLINLTGGSAFSAVLDFLIFNDNEEIFSHQHEFRCWEKRSLSAVTSLFENDFLLSTGHDLGENLGIETGWFRMDGHVANSSATSLQDPAFLAMLVEGVGPHAIADLPYEIGSQDNGDLLPHGVFGDSTP